MLTLPPSMLRYVYRIEHEHLSGWEPFGDEVYPTPSAALEELMDFVLTSKLDLHKDNPEAAYHLSEFRIAASKDGGEFLPCIHVDDLP
jgi:hypothetical protein